jgi:hypothetical protein
MSVFTLVRIGRTLNGDVIRNLTEYRFTGETARTDAEAFAYRACKKADVGYVSLAGIEYFTEVGVTVADDRVITRSAV